MTQPQRVLCSTLLLTALPSLAIDLTQLQWTVVNDTVMGGRSDSTLRLRDGVVMFSGEVSLANNGGFASVRAPYTTAAGGAKALYLTVTGDGKRYQLRLRVDQYLDGPAFVYSFQTQANQQQTWVISEQDFTLQFRGRKVSSDYQLNFSDVRAIGFMISAKQAGPFQLGINELLFVEQV